TPFRLCHRFLLPPDSDLDDIILDLAAVLTKCNPLLPIIIGGDLNLHHDSTAFNDLLRVISSFDISLLSNSRVPTFFGRRNSYRLDYTFASKSLSSASESVLRKVSSDHSPLRVIAKFPRSRLVSECTLQNLSVRLDLDVMNAQPSLATLSSLVCLRMNSRKLSTTSSRTVLNHRRPRSKRPWFSQYSYDLRRRCQSLHRLALRDSSMNSDFLLARTAYHRHLRAAKKEHVSAQTEDLIYSAKRQGLKVLYAPAKKKSAACAIPIHDLRVYCSDLYSDPVAVADTVVERLPSCDVLNHPLLSPFPLDEVSNSLKLLCHLDHGVPLDLSISSLRRAGFAVEAFNGSMGPKHRVFGWDVTRIQQIPVHKSEHGRQIQLRDNISYPIQDLDEPLLAEAGEFLKNDSAAREAADRRRFGLLALDYQEPNTGDDIGEFYTNEIVRVQDEWLNYIYDWSPSKSWILQFDALCKYPRESRVRDRFIFPVMWFIIGAFVLLPLYVLVALAVYPWTSCLEVVVQLGCDCQARLLRSFNDALNAWFLRLPRLWSFGVYRQWSPYAALRAWFNRDFSFETKGPREDAWQEFLTEEELEELLANMTDRRSELPCQKCAEFGSLKPTTGLTKMKRQLRRRSLAPGEIILQRKATTLAPEGTKVNQVWLPFVTIPLDVPHRKRGIFSQMKKQICFDCDFLDTMDDGHGRKT
ncbi:unnamed protein product, partial [Cyprideis torosa]